MSLLVVIGSGETAPTMVKLHREVLARATAPTAGPAVMLDTPFGFQLNADDLVARTRSYFAQSVGTPVEVAGWRSAEAPAADRERALALLARARWAFAGPGSPTYALRQWAGTPIPDALADVPARGGTLVFGSAAACTLGTHAIPVYEIYKVGEEPRWVTGLDLLGRLTGLRAVVIPHYDNAEGGGHDTRFCYLGEPRLAALEEHLPDEAGVLGVDEHTAVIVDLDARTAEVSGSGGATVRRRGVSTVLPAGERVGLDVLDALLRGRQGGAVAAGPSAGARRSGTSARPTAEPGGGRSPSAIPATSLRAEALAQDEEFEAAVGRGDVDGCVNAILALESAIVAWASDTDQNDDVDRARRTLRSMVVRLGDLARDGARDPREVVGGYVELLLELRGRSRTARDYATSDLIRDRLAGCGVEVRDTPDGAQWLLAPP